MYLETQYKDLLPQRVSTCPSLGCCSKTPPTGALTNIGNWLLAAQGAGVARFRRQCASGGRRLISSYSHGAQRASACPLGPYGGADTRHEGAAFLASVPAPRPAPKLHLVKKKDHHAGD